MISDIVPVSTLAPDQLIAMWLHATAIKRSKSKRTQEIYHTTLTRYRMLLISHGLDLDSNDIASLTAIAQAFAGASTQGRNLAPATIAQRLAILSSFYAFAVKRGYFKVNPITMIDRPTVQSYAAAQPVAPHLELIDRSSLQGKRDYALLALLLTTGRRATEIATLTRKQIAIADDCIVMTVTAKGEKKMHDTLAPAVAAALMTYLAAAYPDGMRDDDPIFISCSHRNAGKQISIQTLAIICERYLGTTKIHATRHTFAATMEAQGAPLTTIQDRLGHANAATTSRYLHALASGHNPYADTLAMAFGIR